jgi:hypothetical protein
MSIIAVGLRDLCAQWQLLQNEDEASKAVPVASGQRELIESSDEDEENIKKAVLMSLGANHAAHHHRDADPPIGEVKSFEIETQLTMPFPNDDTSEDDCTI